MVVILDRTSTKKDLEKFLKSLKGKKKFNAAKYCGKIQLKEDALAVQKRLRNEWE